MTSKILVKNKFGLHLRAVARLVLMANSYECSIAVKNNGKPQAPEASLDF